MTVREYTPGGAWTQLFVDRIDAGNAQAHMILQAIARFADWTTGTCYPKVATLAEISKCSDKTVRRYLAKLVDDKIIELTARHDEKSGSQTSSLITLVGYKVWYIANSEGGTIVKPRKVKKYDKPPRQVDQGSKAPPLVKVTKPPGRVLSSPPGQLLTTRELSNNNSKNLGKFFDHDLKREVKVLVTGPSPGHVATARRQRGDSIVDAALDAIKTQKFKIQRDADRAFTQSVANTVLRNRLPPEPIQTDIEQLIAEKVA